MYALRTRICYKHPLNWFRFNAVRCSGDKAATIKHVNYVNKKLYGAVNKRGKLPSMEPAREIASLDLAEYNAKKCPDDYKSEMYWMLEHKAVYDEPLPKNKKSTPKPKPASQKVSSQQTGDTPPPKTKKIKKNKDAAEARPSKDPSSTPTKSTKSGKSKLEISTPLVLTKFTDSLLKPPLKRTPKKAVGKLGNSDERLREILTVPPFDLCNWSSSVEDTVVGTDRLEVRQMPSVSKVLQATMSESSRKALMEWKLLKIAELGAKGFEDLQKSHLSAGSNFHAAIQSYFHTREVPDAKSPVWQVWSSVESAMADIDPDTELVESPIVHPVLQYKGVVDCVSRVDGKLSVIEWKKSDRQKTSIISTYDAPVQLCAYLGAINADPRYALEVRNGLVVVAYTSGEPAHAFRMNEHGVAKYWRIWLNRLHEYWVRHRDGTLPEPI